VDPPLTSSLGQFAAWLHDTAPSQWVRAWPWTWALCETLHFVGLSLLVGVVGLLDVRLMGGLRRIPLAALQPLLPYGIAGFALNAVTGAIFVLGTPEQYLTNVAFGAKLAFLAISGLNVLYFETTQRRRLQALGPDDPVPTAFRVAGAVSIGSWLMVLYWGRMLAYIGHAF
jgi:hypothetical protein